MMMTCQVNLRDPTTVDSRIYVGHLNETITRDLLDIKFSAYGRIVGFLQTQPGFCFIQYEQPSSAKNAIVNENGKLIAAQKLIVKAAEIKGKKGMTGSKNHDFDDANNPMADEPMNKKYFSEQNEYYGNNSIMTLDDNSSDVNHVEIITISQEQNDYAERIEGRLKALGFRVDLLFPNEEVPLNKVLGSIKMTGVKYAILVTAEHELHNSMTIYCLSDDSTEHKNMPTDDALRFIYKDFMVKSKNLKTAFYKHPDSVHTMLKTLVDNRSLTVIQYDFLIQYLGQRREVQRKLEIGLDPTEAETEFVETQNNINYEDKYSNSTIQNKKIQEIFTQRTVPPIPAWQDVPSSLPSCLGSSTTILDSFEIRKRLLKDEKILAAMNILLEEFSKTSF